MNNQIHNPNNVKIGDRVTLDQGWNTENIVIIDSITPRGMFCTVHSEDDINDHWEVMTYRLSPIQAIL